MTNRTLVGRSRKTPLTTDAAPLTGASRRAWTDAMAVRPFGDAYLVETSDGTCVVSLQTSRCSCTDGADRCVHLRRVAIEINLGRVPPPDGRSVHCRGCGTDVAVSIADAPPHLCVDCALEPGDLVVDAAEPGTPLLVVSRPGPPASAITVPDTGWTVAEYPGNGEYPDDAPVIEVVYPLAVSTERAPRRYYFPLPRLERPEGARENRSAVLPPGTPPRSSREAATSSGDDATPEDVSSQETFDDARFSRV